jgi:hypothetical protein
MGGIVALGILVPFATILTLWRHADDWDGVPLLQRVVLAVSASRKWWLAYSVGYLVWWMGLCHGSFREGFPVVLIAIGLAAIFAPSRFTK